MLVICHQRSWLYGVVLEKETYLHNCIYLAKPRYANFIMQTYRLHTRK